MANPLSRFNLSSKITDETVTYLDYTAVYNPLGDFSRIENIDVIINSWNNILLTPRGSYDHDPNYGCDLFDLIYQPADEETQSLIINEIYNSLYLYDDRAKIDDVKINYLRNGKGFSVNIQVNYNGDVKPLSLMITGSK